MADLRELLERAAGPVPPAAPVALIQGLARKRRRRRRLAVGLVAVAAIVAAVVAPRLAAHPPGPANSLRIPQVTVGKLSPGRYTGEVAGTPVTFAVPGKEGWLAPLVSPDSLQLTLLEPALTIEVTTWTSVHTFDEEGVARRETQPVPDDLVQWLQRHPGLVTVGPVVPTRLAGRPAHLVEVVISGEYEPGYQWPEGAAEGCGDPSTCITLGTTADHDIVVYRRSFTYLVITDAPGDRRLIAMAAVPVPTSSEPRDAGRVAQAMLTSFAPAP